MAWLYRAIHRLFLWVGRTIGVIYSKAAARAAAFQEPVGRLPALGTDPDEALRRELAAITRQLDALPFRKTNKRIYALLKSPLGKDLPPNVREHLVERTMRNVFDAVDAGSQVEDLFLREHELEWILYKREHADWYAVEGSVRKAEG